LAKSLTKTKNRFWVKTVFDFLQKHRRSVTSFDQKQKQFLIKNSLILKNSLKAVFQTQKPFLPLASLAFIDQLTSPSTSPPTQHPFKCFTHPFPIFYRRLFIDFIDLLSSNHCLSGRSVSFINSIVFSLTMLLLSMLLSFYYQFFCCLLSIPFSF
jgi:hypothetical protein